MVTKKSKEMKRTTWEMFERKKRTTIKEEKKEVN